jgi:hypothetical protein
MASTHKSLRSGTANKRPTTSIADGQIALNTNTTSPGLFFKDSTGATIIKVGPVHVGTTAPNASPAAGGSAGNSVGEIWLDTSLTPVGVKIWNGSAFVNATPIGSTTVQGLLELATSAETQTGTDTDRAVTPAGLQSKVSDSTSTTSSTTIASSTAVKSAYDLANAALPKSGGTVTGNLEIGTTGSLSFEGATADAFETTIAVTDPTADRTITLPDTTGTVVTTGDTGTVTSAMIADGTIVDGDISASAEIAVSKLADGTARQLLQTDAAGTGVEWASNIDVPGTLDVTSTATFDSIASHPLGSAAAPTLTFTGDTNTGIYSPGADQVAISTNGTARLFVNSSGDINIGHSSSSYSSAGRGLISVNGSSSSIIDLQTGATTRFRMFCDGTDVELVNTEATGVIKFGTNSAERMRLDSSGRLGLGTTSPLSPLHVRGGSVIAQSASTASATVSFYAEAADAAGTVNAPVNLVAATHGATGQGGSQFYVETRIPNGGLTRALTIDSSQRVGIGTTSPGKTLEVSTASTTDGIALSRAGSNRVLLTADGLITWGATANQGTLTWDANQAIIRAAASNSLVFAANNSSEHARIDTSGRLLVGTSSSSVLAYSSEPSIQVESNSYFKSSLSVFNNENTDSGSILSLGKSRGTAVGSNTVVQSGDYLGEISWVGADGSDRTSIAASINCRVDGTPGSNDMPGRLVFSTTADGASSPTERFRINNAGSFSAVIPSGSTLYPAFWSRAWVNFNGTGTVAIRGSGNVSSITDNGVGNYTVNFTTAMADTNYAVVSTAGRTYTSSDAGRACDINRINTNNFSITVFEAATYALDDVVGVLASVFR